MLSDRHIEYRDGDCALARAHESPHEIGGNRTAGQRVNGDDSEAAAIGCVGRHAYDGNARSRSAANCWPQRLGTAWENNDPVRLLVDGGLKRFFFALAEART